VVVEEEEEEDLRDLMAIGTAVAIAMMMMSIVARSMSHAQIFPRRVIGQHLRPLPLLVLVVFVDPLVPFSGTSGTTFASEGTAIYDVSVAAGIGGRYDRGRGGRTGGCDKLWEMDECS